MNHAGVCRTEEYRHELGNGLCVSLFRMTNRAGHYAECCNYGGRILGIVVPDRKGQLANVVLRYPSLTDYLSDPYYLGATIGPIANRITRGQYEVGGRRYQLPCNDGCHCNHSGDLGLDKVLFSGRVDPDGSVVLSARVPRTDAYSANLEVAVRYTFTDADELIADYWAHADGACCVNLTNHAYFNLSGGEGDVSAYRFRTGARRYLVQDEAFLPTGEILPIEGLRTSDDAMPLGLVPRNTYYVFEENGPHNASLWDDSSGRRLDVVTTQPGVLLYSGFCLGEPYRPYAGVCLETQGFPDAPTHPEFPSIALGGDETYRHCTVYKFSTC